MILGLLFSAYSFKGTSKLSAVLNDINPKQIEAMKFMLKHPDYDFSLSSDGMSTRMKKHLASSATEFQVVATRHGLSSDLLLPNESRERRGINQINKILEKNERTAQRENFAKDRQNRKRVGNPPKELPRHLNIQVLRAAPREQRLQQERAARTQPKLV